MESGKSVSLELYKRQLSVIRIRRSLRKWLQYRRLIKDRVNELLTVGCAYISYPIYRASRPVPL
jgi:hypothetical protein